ncbi:MAG: leucyl-tRNA synthetase [Patescibacteria group bacterium]|nr:leucyl-tRNA synthetase [Patescibacteria group bacterium]
MKQYDHKKIEKKWPDSAKATTGKQVEYNHKKIEKKWQEKWQQDNLYQTSDFSSKPKCFVLDMFPYPSGEGLHVGHPKGYIATDVYSRMKTMQGFNVLHPMGFDAFGLPAENYALKNKIHPRVAVEKNIARYKKQLEMIGFNYDWDREINTTDPEYYKWTQWIFLQMFKKGLAYESFAPINWCPSCQTGLANEDLEDGRCERCSSEIEKRPMRQWVLKITDYADRLLQDLDLLDWPKHIKESQKNWIGRSEGALIKFPLIDSFKYEVEVFTTRPDTIFGATFLAVSPELAKTWFLMNWEASVEVKDYIDQTLKDRAKQTLKDNPEKTGINSGLLAKNPASGENIPVWITNYVLGDVGTGAIMAVPAHDDRDFEFATKYNLKVQEVVIPNRIDITNPPVAGKKSVVRSNVHAIVRNSITGKILCLNWLKHPWVTFPMGGVEEGEDIESAARREVLEETGYKNLKLIKILGGQVRAEYFAAHKDENRIAFTQAVMFDLENEDRDEVKTEESEAHEVIWLEREKIKYPYIAHSELNDWLSRWDDDKKVFIGEGVLVNSGQFNDLNSVEAQEKIVEFVGGKKTTTYKLKDWVFSRQRYWGEPIPIIHCVKCGVVPVPEKDLPVKLPEVEHYEPTGTGESPLANITDWVNTTCPVCGGEAKRETNTMPQWAGSSWYYLRYMDPKNKQTLVDPLKEKYWAPVDVYVGGTEHATRHLIYARFWHKFLYDIGVVSTLEPFARIGKSLGLILGEDGKKMSKRFGNVVNPDEVVALYGADTLRVYEMFMGPFDGEISWSTDSMIGSRRFLEKVWRLQSKIDINNQADNAEVLVLVHQTIKKVGEDIESFSFNTAISSLMILVNKLETLDKINLEIYQILLKILAPFAPHVTEEIWQNNNFGQESITLSSWPSFDGDKLSSDEITIIIQINGKLREKIVVGKDLPDGELLSKVKTLPKVQTALEGKVIEKEIVVKNRLVNFVIV